MPRAQALTTVLEEEPVRPSTPGLSVAERHLLQTHREELGELLRQRCVMEFFAQPDAELRWHRCLTVDRIVEVPSREGWNERATTTLECGLGEDEPSRLSEKLLVMCIQNGAQRSVGVGQLGRASLRVAPQDYSRVYLAMDMLEGGRPGEAMRAYEQVLDGSRSSLIRSYCLEGMAVIHYLQGNLPSAAEAYQRSAEADGSRPVPLLGRLVVAVAMGATEETRIAASLVEGIVPVGHLAVKTICWATKHHLRTGVLKLDSTQRARVAQIAELLGLVTRGSRCPVVRTGFFRTAFFTSLR